MNFNGKNLILIGSLLFIFQLPNFFSIESITPALERAQVLSAITSVIIILIGFLFEQFKPVNSKRIVLEGENDFIFDSKIPKDLLDELAWGSEAILTSTAAASVLIHCDGKNILRRGIISNKIFLPGETCKRSIKDLKLISLANLKFYPGREEFYNFCPNIPSILLVPINEKTFLLIGGWSTRCFTKSDEKWVTNWAKKLSSILSKNNI